MRTPAIILVALAALLPATALGQRVGTTAAVNPAARGTPPGGESRLLVVGSDVQFEERIVTSPSGQTQLLFLDQSTLTVGPNAEVVLDRFVYDPSTSTGELAISVTKGVFRFVGGRISANNGATLRTPTATLGIRGSIVAGETETGLVYYIAGDQLTVTNQTGSELFPRPHRVIEIASLSSEPLDRGRIRAGDIARLNGVLQGAGGAGASQIPTQAGAEAGLAGRSPSTLDPKLAGQNDFGSAIGPQLGGLGDDVNDGKQTQRRDTVVEDIGNEVPGGPGGGPVTPVPAQPGGRYYSTGGAGSERGFVTAVPNTAVPESFRDQFTAFTASGGRFTATVLGDTYSAPQQVGSFAITPQDTESPFGPLEGVGFFDPASQFGFYAATEVSFLDEHSFLFYGRPLSDAQASPILAQAGLDSYGLRSDVALGAGIPFLRPEGGGDVGGASVSNLLVSRNGGTAGTATAFQASVAVSGTGSAQQSTIVVFTGGLFIDAADHLSLGGGMVGSARLGGTERPIVSEGGVETVPGPGGQRFYGPLATASDGTQQAQRIDHFVLGSDFSQNGVYAPSNAVEQPYELDTRPGPPERGTNYSYVHVASRTSQDAIGAPRTTRTLNGYAAALGETRLAGDVFPTSYEVSNTNPDAVRIDTNAASSRASASFALTGTGGAASGDAPPVTSGTYRFGGFAMEDAGRSSFVDNDRFAARESESSGSVVNGKPGRMDDGRRIENGALVSSGAVPRSPINPGTTYCECRFAEWGYWAHEFVHPDTSGPEAGRRERVHAGFWVAGELPRVSEIPLTGTASYAGHVIGNVDNGGIRYLADGNFRYAHDFGRRTGTAEITGFDGADYRSVAGGITSQNGRDLSGVLSGGQSGRSAALNASFFRGGADPVAEIGGKASFRGPNYKASAIVVGRKAAGGGPVLQQ